MTLKQMLDDKDKKINDLRIEMNGKIEGIKLELKNEIKNEIKDLNEIKEFWITGLQIRDNFDVLKGRFSYHNNNRMFLECHDDDDKGYLNLLYVSLNGKIEKQLVSYSTKNSYYMPVSLGKYLGLKPA